jgi:pimeloyl-ACP methyl ester carboxylesterase
VGREPNLTPEQLGSIRAPTMVIAGDRDLVEVEHTVALFRSIPGAQLCVLPGTGQVRRLPGHFFRCRAA